jgi:hypothetical protein
VGFHHQIRADLMGIITQLDGKPGNHGREWENVLLILVITGE